MPTSSASTLQPLERRFRYSTLPGLAMAGVMLLIRLAETVASADWGTYGLRPRNPAGLFGILSFPFLHADWLHLFSNLVPFVLLSTLIFNLFPRLAPKVYLFTFVLSGFWTWCFARPGVVIGASGWVYALLGFLLVAGFARVSHRTMIIAGGLAFLYGGMVEGLVPARPHISWEGHLMGLIAGALAAWYWRKDLKKMHLAEWDSLKPKPLPDVEPPYPYWLHNGPHVIDAQRNVIHPDDLIWENGRPYLRPSIEPDVAEPNPDTATNTPPKPIRIHTTASPYFGTWIYTSTE